MTSMRASFFGTGTQKVRCSDILGTFAVGSLAIFFLMVSGSVDERLALAAPESSNPLSGDSDAIAVGQTLYRANCGYCHGLRANGRGRGLPNSSDLRKFKKGFSKFVVQVTEGGKTMPPFGGMKKLNEEEIKQVGAYLETLAVRRANWLDPPKN